MRILVHLWWFGLFPGQVCYSIQQLNLQNSPSQINYPFSIDKFKRCLWNIKKKPAWMLFIQYMDILILMNKDLNCDLVSPYYILNLANCSSWKGSLSVCRVYVANEFSLTTFSVLVTPTNLNALLLFQLTLLTIITEMTNLKPLLHLRLRHGIWLNINLWNDPNRVVPFS